jgi:hypothetical protein
VLKVVGGAASINPRHLSLKPPSLVGPLERLVEQLRVAWLAGVALAELLSAPLELGLMSAPSAPREALDAEAPLIGGAPPLARLNLDAVLTLF